MKLFTFNGFLNEIEALILLITFVYSFKNNNLLHKIFSINLFVCSWSWILSTRFQVECRKYWKYKISATKLNEGNYSFFGNNSEYSTIKYKTRIYVIN
jgi:hypothetical protein